MANYINYKFNTNLSYANIDSTNSGLYQKEDPNNLLETYHRSVLYDRGEPNMVDTSQRNIRLEPNKSVIKRKESIHSGHFMISQFEVDDEEDEIMPQAPNDDTKMIIQPATSIVSRPAVLLRRSRVKSSVIETSLTKLFECMSLAYRQKLTSPKWNRFKGIRLRWKDKIRLNNVIWRCWHMQFVTKKHALVCQFASPLDSDTHNKPEAVVLEGKYWKRKLHAVTAEYKKWRQFFHFHRQDSEEFADILEWQPGSNESNSNASMLLDEDYMEFMSDTLFSALSSQSFCFPDSKEMSRVASLADFIQPSLVQLQPNLDDLMDSFEPFHDLLCSKLPTVPEEYTSLSQAQSVSKSSPSVQPNASNTSSNSPSISSKQERLSENQPNNIYRNLEETSSLLPLQSSSSPHIKSEAKPGSSSVGYNLQGQEKGSVFSYAPSSNMESKSSTYVYNDPMKCSETSYVGHSATHIVPQYYAEGKQSSSQIVQYNYVKPMTSQPSIYANYNKSMTTNQQAYNSNYDKSYSQYNHDTRTSYNSNTFPSQQQQYSPSPVNNQQQSYQHPNNTIQTSTQPFNLQQTRNLQQSGSYSSGGAPPPPPSSTYYPNSNYQQALDFKIPASTSSNYQSQPNRNNSSANELSPTSPGNRRSEDYSLPPKQPAMKQRNRTRSGCNLINTQHLLNAANDPNLVHHNSALLAQLLTSHTHTSYGGLPKAPAVCTGETISCPGYTGRSRTPDSVYIPPAQEQVVPAAPSYPPYPPKSHFLMSSQSESSLFNINLISSRAANFNPNFHRQNKILQRKNQQRNLDNNPSADLYSMSQQGQFVSNSRASSSSSIAANSPSSKPPDSPEPLSLSPTSPGLSSPPHRPSPYKEHRRVCHINAEQKRRCNIKNGFDTLHLLIPHLSQNPNSKMSKAAMLQKGADYIKQLRSERSQLKDEIESLRHQVDSLNVHISNSQSLLPATGAPVSRHRVTKMKEMFDDYVAQRTQDNWKYWLLSLICEPLINSFNCSVSSASMEELYRTSLQWSEQHCSLGNLRPIVLSALRYLSTETEILSDPNLLPEEALRAVTRPS